MIETFAKKSFDELSEEQELKLEKNIVWIFGFREWDWFDNEIFPNSVSFMNEPAIGLHLNDFSVTKNGQRSTLLNSLQKIGKKEKFDYFFYNGFYETWNYYLRKLILERIRTQFDNKETPIVIKEFNGSIGANMISNCLPNSKIVVILQNNKELVSSLVTQFKKSGKSFQRGGKTIRSDDAKLVTEYFTERINIQQEIFNQCTKMRSPDLYYVPTKEMIQENPRKFLQEIFKFANLQFNSHELDICSKLLTHAISPSFLRSFLHVLFEIIKKSRFW